MVSMAPKDGHPLYCHLCRQGHVTWAEEATSFDLETAMLQDHGRIQHSL